LEIKSISISTENLAPKIYSFGLTTFWLGKRKNPMRLAKLIRRSEAWPANWYTLTLHWLRRFEEDSTGSKAKKQKAAKRTATQRGNEILGQIQILSGDKDNA